MILFIMPAWVIIRASQAFGVMITTNLLVYALYIYVHIEYII